MKPIHNLLRQRLYRTQKPFLEHPPMDLLGAFAEKALSGPDRSRVVEHLAQCGDCRDVIFLAAGPSEMAVMAAQGTTPRKSSWPMLRWGSAAACAVIVFAAMRMHSGNGARPAEIGPQLTASQQASFTIKQQAASATAFLAAAPAAALRRSIPGKAKEVPRGLTTESLPTLSRGASNGPPRWALNAAGTLQRSLDGGITWQPVYFAHYLVFRAVAADGRRVWLGGANGVLFHTADAGRHWAQVKSTASQQLPTSDIIGIQFEDHQHGKLTTASNESWITSDAGNSWQKQ